MPETRPSTMQPLPILQLLKHLAFIAMLADAIWIFFLGLTAKSDSPAFRNIGGASLSSIQNMYVHRVWLYMTRPVTIRSFTDAV
jgi:hypothetical protein